MAEKFITVYVRKDGDNVRTLSFDRVPEISDSEALKQGYAIDGRSLVRAVTAGGSWDARPLMGAVRQAQMRLCEWLEEKGYTAEFA